MGGHDGAQQRECDRHRGILEVVLGDVPGMRDGEQQHQAAENERNAGSSQRPGESRRPANGHASPSSARVGTSTMRMSMAAHRPEIVTDRQPRSSATKGISRANVA